MSWVQWIYQLSMISCYVTQPFGSDVATLYTTSDWTAGSVPPKAAVLFAILFYTVLTDR